MVTSVIHDEIEWSKFLHHSLQKGRIRLTPDPDMNARRRRIELEAFG